MEATREFRNNLKQGIITEDMIAACLFSLDKRAEEYRAKANEYKQRYNTPTLYDKFDNQGKYLQKERTCYEQKEKLLSLLSPVCIHAEETESGTNYYLYYEIDSHPFNIPISESELAAHPVTGIKQIDKLPDTSDELNDILSTRFVNAVLELIEKDSYIDVDSIRNRPEANQTLKSWYQAVFPDDTQSLLMNESATFIDLVNCLNSARNVYDNCIGVSNSIIRERLFARLAYITGIDYTFIYNKWLYNKMYVLLD